ncbi:hypothetical protein [Halegenticoccus soli]|uniref:hypothetical protein n=1 Tax=Halegenticoccus soli TaxID=1985678 RepID=UPI000C6CE66B|nr:hypothetical protein [Halegenticoccus soli]
MGTVIEAHRNGRQYPVICWERWTEELPNADSDYSVGIQQWICPTEMYETGFHPEVFTGGFTVVGSTTVLCEEDTIFHFTAERQAVSNSSKGLTGIRVFERSFPPQARHLAEEFCIEYQSRPIFE